jgi:hypothetical protein
MIVRSRKTIYELVDNVIRRTQNRGRFAIAEAVVKKKL